MKKHRKEKTIFYRGVCILKDSVYTDNDLFNNKKSLKGFRFMLMTPDIERYFKTVGQARAYVDSNFEEIKKQSFSSYDDCNDDYKTDLNDEIPF